MFGASALISLGPYFSTLGGRLRSRGLRCRMTVEIRYLTDPACIWSWGAEPQVRRLMWEFADGIRFRWVLGGLARSYGSSYRDEEGGIGSRDSCFADLM